MDEHPKLQIAGIICAGILKLLWYLFLAAVGIFIFIWMVALEAAKQGKNRC